MLTPYLTSIGQLQSSMHADHRSGGEWLENVERQRHRVADAEQIVSVSPSHGRSSLSLIDVPVAGPLHFPLGVTASLAKVDFADVLDNAFQVLEQILHRTIGMLRQSHRRSRMLCGGSV